MGHFQTLLQGLFSSYLIVLSRHGGSNILSTVFACALFAFMSLLFFDKTIPLLPFNFVYLCTMNLIPP